MEQDLHTLEFDTILNMLSEHAVSGSAKEILLSLRPEMNESVCLSRMRETTEARRVLDALGAPPLAMMEELEPDLDTAVRGGMLMPRQLSRAAAFCASVRAIKRYFGRARGISPVTASRQVTLPEMDELENAITAAVREEELLDDASGTLRDLRRLRERMEQEIRGKLEQLSRQFSRQLSDGYVTTRNGRYVLPVKKQFRNIFPGKAVEVSAKGGTVFMEPIAVEKLQSELDGILIALDAEERRILWELSDLLAGKEEEIRSAAREMTAADVLFAKAKLSAAMKANEVTLTAERRILLRSARHPLLDPETCVPLELTLEAPCTGIAITGPNTGGKTVTLRTVGLLCLMAQSGLHVPCLRDSVLPLTDGVYADIGDSQSVALNLSTFSGHMLNMIRILKRCSRDSLVLLDEPGSGTDPAEGSGIAIAVLEELKGRGNLFMATTHDPRVKLWSEKTEGVIPARMAFDRENLQPLYRLEMGLSGESCAIEIARRLGMEERLLNRAREAACEGREEGVRVTSKNNMRPGMAPASRLRRENKALEPERLFEMGDSVALLPEHTNAIVYIPDDEKGNVVIRLQGRNMTVNRKRLQLLVPARELYPPDYDFSIIFESVHDRKAAHTMDRKHDPEAVIVHREGKKNE